MPRIWSTPAMFVVTAWNASMSCFASAEFLYAGMAKPPWSSTATPRCLFVVRQDYSDQREVRRALTAAELTEMKVLGFVFYGEKVNQGSYYSKRYYNKYYNSYYHSSDHRKQEDAQNHELHHEHHKGADNNEHKA